jgi:hypothetical protein
MDQTPQHLLPPPPTSQLLDEPPQKNYQFFIVVAICFFFIIGAAVIFFQKYNTTDNLTKAGLDRTMQTRHEEYVIPPVERPKNDISNDGLENDLRALDGRLGEVERNDTDVNAIDPDQASDSDTVL